DGDVHDGDAVALEGACGEAVGEGVVLTDQLQGLHRLVAAVDVDEANQPPAARQPRVGVGALDADLGLVDESPTVMVRMGLLRSAPYAMPTAAPNPALCRTLMPVPMIGMTAGKLGPCMSSHLAAPG